MIGVKLSAPIRSIVNSPRVKFQLVKIARSNKGVFEYSVLQIKNNAAIRQMNSSVVISKDSNQSNL